MAGGTEWHGMRKKVKSTIVKETGKDERGDELQKAVAVTEKD